MAKSADMPTDAPDADRRTGYLSMTALKDGC